MEEDIFSLKKLKEIFMEVHKNEFYYNLLNDIYDIYEKEFLIQFGDFYTQLLKTYDPNKKENIEEELFKYDVMQNICNILYYKMFIYRMGYEFDLNQTEKLSPIVLVHYLTDKELNEKKEKLQKKAKELDIRFYIFYLDKRQVKSEIEGLLLMPNILLSMTNTSTTQTNKNYRMKLGEKDNLISSLEEDAAFVDKFRGGKLTEERKQMYEAILDIRSELEKKYGKGHRSSLTRATENYLKKTEIKYPNKKKVKNITTRIGDLISQGRIEDNKIIF